MKFVCTEAESGRPDYEDIGDASEREDDVPTMEELVKAELKEENLIVRGSEWANVEGWKLQDIIKKHIKNVHGDIITPVKLNTRSANSRYTSRNRSGLVR